MRSSAENEKHPKGFKVVFLGDSSVGKTSVIIRACSNSFSSLVDTTIGASFIEKEVETDKGPIILNIWDTAGQEKYRSLVSAYMRGCTAAIVCFSMDNIESYNNLDNWIDQIKGDSEDCVLVICGNKTDLTHAISDEEIAKWSEDNSLPIFQTSAKTGEGVEDMFLYVSQKLAESIDNYKEMDDIKFNQCKKKEEQKNCC